VDDCTLRKRVRGTQFACDEDGCVFWAQLGLEAEGARRCAVKYFQLLDAPGQELAEWLLSLKEEQIVEALGMRKVPPAK